MEVNERIRPNPRYGIEFELLKLRCMYCGHAAAADVRR